jgi:uncharacterized protein YecE (DUF72 family)
MPDTRIGISGWRYAPWRGKFYPEDLPQKRELEYASRQLSTIEINGTFYSLQRPSSFRAWYDATPENFLFAVKCPRYITHMRRLKEIDEPLANFYASGVLALGKKMGPMLWQFPPNFKFDAPRFDDFFSRLPRTIAEAVKVARGHGVRMKGRSYIPSTPSKQPIRHCIEFRHESFLVPEFIELLRRQKIGLVLADTAKLHPYAEDITADFVYLRLHGAEQIYASGYTEKALDWWAQRIDAWRTGGEPADASKVLPKKPPPRKSRDIYVYFDNDIKVHAPFDAMSLAKRLNAPLGDDARELVRPSLTRDEEKALANDDRPHPFRRSGKAPRAKN